MFVLIRLNGYYGVFDCYPGGGKRFVGTCWIRTVDEKGDVIQDGLDELFELSQGIRVEIKPLVDKLLKVLSE